MAEKTSFATSAAGRRDFGPPVRPDRPLRPVRGHEQDPEHQALPGNKARKLFSSSLTLRRSKLQW